MDSLLSKFAAARARRDPLRNAADGATDALRLLDGMGDGPEFSDLVIDDFAGRWLVQTTRPETILPVWLRQVHPAPLAIYWKRLDAHEKGPPQWWQGECVESPFEVLENGVRFRIDFAAGYSQGLFLDQRNNRAALRKFCATAAGTTRPEPPSVLNCFAYTCAFSVVAAAGGAHTASVDLTRTALDWGQENFRLNGLPASPSEGQEFFSGDVFDHLRRFAKKSRRFAAIVLDPPTFSRDRAGSIFRVERDYSRLVGLAAPLVSAGGTLLCCTNQRSLSSGPFQRQLDLGLEGAGGATAWRRAVAPMPADFTGDRFLKSVWLTRTD